MRGVGGIRTRLAATLVALVVLTASVLGLGSYAFVEASLRERMLRAAEDQARFDLTVLIPSRLASDPDLGRLLETLGGRTADTIVDPGPDFLARLPPDFHRLVEGGQLAYHWATIGGPVLVIGGRLPPGGPTFYFVHDASALEAALGQLRLALVAGGLGLALLALLAARRVARGVLAPVEAAGQAAERIEHGDLSARVPVASRDEFGTWAERFNRMAAALEETIGRLEASQAQNRRFVADVSHELRTPLTALVAEASILREHLDALPPDARRTGELLVDDVARLRTLVDELMELSRFDAAAEVPSPEPVDLGRIVTGVAAARLPEARIRLPEQPLVVATDRRRLERIVGNLLDNAREHAPGAPVQVTVAAVDGEVEIAVADGGPGVPPDRLPRIFDRFYKVDPSRHGGSSGLGLAIAAEHAAVLGGFLEASNQPTGGLRIAVRLPVTGSLPGGNGVETAGSEGGAPTSVRQEPIR